MTSVKCAASSHIAKEAVMFAKTGQIREVNIAAIWNSVRTARLG